ncbi:unnamed protein product [Macrosiphum euphorbiae]|nr:unnamed protein product [Macrosiphum euphorbiae]
MVHKEYFNPVHGYAISPFKSPNEDRNHFHHRNVNNKIKIIVLHFTVLDFGTTVKEFTSKRSNTSRNVSSHYVIARPTEARTHNQLLQVVPENCVSNHAGISLWGNYSLINSISIGIEIVNYGYNATNDSWDPFYQDQIRIVGLMVARMVDQYKVLPHYVVGHSDIAPNRKIDPGVMFPWRKLYKNYGIGAWLDNDEMNETVVIAKYSPSTPCPSTPDQKLFVNYLGVYGYNISDEIQAIKAFKAHFTANQKPKLYNSLITRLEMYWIWALVAKYSH